MKNNKGQRIPWKYYTYIETPIKVHNNPTKHITLFKRRIYIKPCRSRTLYEYYKLS